MIPILIAALSGILVLLVGALGMRRWALPLVVLSLLSINIFSIIGIFQEWDNPFNAMLLCQKYQYLGFVIMSLSTLLVILLSTLYYHQESEHLTDKYGLLLFSLSGGMILISFNNLSMMFLGIEILSIPLYVLSASHKTRLSSNEAGLKYFIMGAFSTCFLLLGICLVYGSSQSLDFNTIKTYLETNNNEPLCKAGIFFISIAFLFKIAAAPFHFWTPDVYTGAPSIITVFMATVVKTAAVLGFYIFLSQLNLPEQLYNVFSIAIVLSIIIANTSALWQKNFKRLMAYSSVSNAGLLLLAFYSKESISIICFYLFVYSLANIVALGIFIWLNKLSQHNQITQFKGLLSQSPLLAIAFAISMLSLSGIPPLAGFIGKFLLIKSAIQTQHIVVAIVAIIGSIIAVYYYLQLGFNALIGKNTELFLPATPKLLQFIIIFCSIALLALGILPQIVLGL